MATNSTIGFLQATLNEPSSGGADSLIGYIQGVLDNPAGDPRNSAISFVRGVLTTAASLRQPVLVKAGGVWKLSRTSTYDDTTDTWDNMVTAIDPNAMPAHSLPDWTVLWANDFNYNYAVGAIDTDGNGVIRSTSPAYAELRNVITSYPNGWDTSHTGEADADSGLPIHSMYQPTKTISFANSMAVVRLWSETLAGVNTAYGATIKPILPGGYKLGPSGRWSFRMHTKSMVIGGVDYAAANNFTTNPRSWRQMVPLGISSTWSTDHEEIDYPEGGVDQRVAGNLHPHSATNVTLHVTINPATSPYQWSIYTVEWVAGSYIKLWLNDVLVYTLTANVPIEPLAVLLQFETDNRQPVGDATLEIDWMVVWGYTPGSGGDGAAIYDLSTYDLAVYGA